jgi:multidrug efflux pump subunit AcrB
MTKHSAYSTRILDRFYDRGIDAIFKHKALSVLFCCVAVPLCVYLFYAIPKSRMPEIEQNELISHIEWNENIHIDENWARVNALFMQTDELSEEHTGYIGQQQFLLNKDKELSSSEAELYFKTKLPTEVEPLQKDIESWIKQHYPQAVVSFSPPETVFEKLFVTGEADIVAELYTRDKTNAPQMQTIRTMEEQIEVCTGEDPVGISFENQLNITIDREKLLLYNVNYEEVHRVLKTAFKENDVATLRSYQQYLPITLVGREQTVNEVMQNTLIRTLPDKNREVQYIPLQSLISIAPSEDLKTITAGKNGEFIPFSFYDVADAPQLMKKTREEVSKSSDWDLDFSGSFFSNQQMLNELVIILLISILLMYFILAAQFESFAQPLIVLIEIPIDVAFALLLLWITGHSLNLMSAIGIVVTCGIIINDSILKIDAINEFRKAGMPLLEAIHEAGKRRLRPIVMTSLTTIFGMVPLLFSFDMGSELQKPLAIAMIGAMVVGTLVSLFIIPLIYWYIYRNENVEKQIANEKQ